MSWTLEDVESHKSDLTEKQKEVWVAVANSARQKCIEKGGDEKECDISAIKQASKVAGEALHNDVLESVEYDDEDNMVVTFYANDETFTAETEIFSVGKWNKDNYTTDDLDQMVDAFECLKGKWRPYLKLGHNDKTTGVDQPALGYVDKLKRVGEKLLATITNIPKTVKDSVEKGLYGKRSCEVFWNYTDDGKKYPRVLKAIALLGASVPAVTNLKDIEKFFDYAIYEEQNNYDELREYEIDEKKYVKWDEDDSNIVAEINSASDFLIESLHHVPFPAVPGVIMVMGKPNPEMVNANEDMQTEKPHKWLFDRNMWTLKKATKWLVGGYWPESVTRSFVTTMKTDGGIEYPKEAYLYVPDTEKPSTWKLRIWEDPDKKVTIAQLGRAAAAFSSGGVRGQSVDLPTDEMKKIKQKLISLYKGQEVDEESIPKHLFNYENNKGGSNMNWEEILAAKEKEIIELKDQLKRFEQEKNSTKIAELTEGIETMESEIQTLKSYKEKAEKAEKELVDKDKIIAAKEKENAELRFKERESEMKMYIQKMGVQGEKKILPRDEVLVTQILLTCPEEKLYSVEGKEEKLSLADMIKEFISRQSIKVDTSQHSGKDKDEKIFENVGNEVDNRTKDYVAEHSGTTYYEAMKAVLAADPELKQRYWDSKKS